MTAGVTSLIAVDWGTTSLRAWRMDASGGIIDRKRDKLGIQQVAGGDFAAAFRTALGDWADAAPAAPVLMSGMIGSRQGWVEAPYASCPAGIDDIAQHLARVPRHERIRIVPGLSLRPREGAPDVMRGEETQIFGMQLAQNALVILPGTHSKWTSVRSGKIDWFASFMTGEVYDVLKRHSILGRMMEDVPAADIPGGFEAGCAYALGGKAGTLQSLFSVRTRGLFGELSAQDSPGYLSGLLIGSEIREALAALKARSVTPSDAVLVGAPALTALYAFALKRAGISTSVAGEDCCAHGLFRIARMSGLVQT
jgi:2-dehydro-3-deoxygalactonokinase